MTTIFYRLAREGRVVVRFDQITPEIRWDQIKETPRPCEGADRVDPFVEDGLVYAWVHSRAALTEEERCTFRTQQGARCKLRSGHGGFHNVD